MAFYCLIGPFMILWHFRVLCCLFIVFCGLFIVFYGLFVFFHGFISHFLAVIDPNSLCLVTL